MNTLHWIRHFEANARYKAHRQWPVTVSTLQDHVREPLARSLATFQLGESGGGTRLRRYAREVAPLEQFRGYQRAIDLFIAEEQGHAELLARVVKHLGGQLKSRQWTNSVFRKFRTLINLDFNIQILLTAELIAESYYGQLYLGVNDPMVRQAAKEILRDEIHHLSFQRDFLAERISLMRPWKRRLWSLQFRVVHRVVCRVVAWDHRTALRAIGVPPGAFVHLATRCLTQFNRRLMRHPSITGVPEWAPHPVAAS